MKHSSRIGLNNIITGIVVLIALLLCSAAMAQEAPAAGQATKAVKHPVAVMPFAPPDDVVRRGNWRLYSDHVTDGLISELVDYNITVVERNSLGKLDNEQLLKLNGQVEQAVELGKKTGAQLMIVGSITNLGVRTRKFLLYVENTLEVQLRARVIDIRTGEILKTYTGSGNDVRRGIINPYTTEGSEESNVFQKAMDKAVKDMGKKFSDSYPALVANLPTTVPTKDTSVTQESGLSPAGQAQLDKLKASGELKRLTIMVMIPETHIQRPRIPDPAAETEIIRQFVAAGFKVLDDKRVQDLREETWVRELGRGQIDEAKLKDLKSRFGADVIVVGEGISERAENSRVGDPAVLVRARVELRALRTENGEILMADAVHEPGRDLSEALASKASLQQAGKTIAPRLIEAVVNKGFETVVVKESATVELEIGGWLRISEAQDFLTTLSGVKGIKRAVRKDYRGGVLFADVEATPDGLKDLAIWLETDAMLKRFGIAVDTSTSTKITAAAHKVPGADTAPASPKKKP